MTQNYNNYFRASRETEYLDWKKAKRMTLAKLKPSVKTISLRLPESMLVELKLLANKRDVPYQEDSGCKAVRFVQWGNIMLCSYTYMR